MAPRSISGSTALLPDVRTRTLTAHCAGCHFPLECARVCGSQVPTAQGNSVGMSVLWAESDYWLGFTWFTATLGYCYGQKLRSSGSRFPPGGQVRSPEPCYSTEEYFTGWGKPSALQASSDQSLQSISLHPFFFLFPYLPSNSSYFPTLKTAQEVMF